MKRSRETSNSAMREIAVKCKPRPAALRPNKQQTVADHTNKHISATQLQASASAGSRRALCALAKRYFLGRGVATNFAAAEALFQTGAEKGHVPSMFYLASMWVGRSRPGSVAHQRGLLLMQAAAECGHPRAAHHAAILQLTTKHSACSPLAAAQLLHTAAASGYPPSVAALGAMFEAGVGVKGSTSTAQALYEAAARHNIKDAVGALGALLAEPETSAADKERAMGLFLAGASGGDLDCAYSLGVMYATGHGTNAPDLGKALRWLTLAASAGDPAAQNAVGNILGDPESPLRDDKQAVVWYRRAAGAGHAEAQNNLAWMLERGHGCDVDMKAAVKLYTQAAKAGHADAVYNLASLYIEGDSMAPDDALAIRLLLPLAKAGDHTAEFLLGGRLAEAAPPLRDEAAAVRWYTAAADGGHAGAACALGVMHHLGRGTEANLAAAARWYCKARDLGDEDAEHNLQQLRRKRQRPSSHESSDSDGEGDEEG